MIRPELHARAARWSESLVAAAILLGGLWLAFRGGWFFAALGGLVLLVGLALLIGAIRRLPFRRKIAAPGVVEVDEGAIRYYGAAALGGEIALRDLSEIRLLRLNGRAHWRLKSLDGQALLVPVDARGADGLASAFAALPGVDMGRISAALKADGPTMQTLWTRNNHPRLTCRASLATCGGLGR